MTYVITLFISHASEIILQRGFFLMLDYEWKTEQLLQFVLVYFFKVLYLNVLLKQSLRNNLSGKIYTTHSSSHTELG